jgi:hypothetical protein
MMSCSASTSEDLIHWVVGALSVKKDLDEVCITCTSRSLQPTAILPQIFLFTQGSTSVR